MAVARILKEDYWWFKIEMDGEREENNQL